MQCGVWSYALLAGTVSAPEPMNGALGNSQKLVVVRPAIFAYSQTAWTLQVPTDLRYCQLASLSVLFIDRLSSL